MMHLPGPHSDEVRQHRHHAIEDWDGELLRCCLMVQCAFAGWDATGMSPDHDHLVFRRVLGGYVRCFAFHPWMG